MPKTYGSHEAFKEYSDRIGYAADYREAMGVMQSAFSCLALTNEQIRELQALAWKKNKGAHDGRAVLYVRIKGGGVVEVVDRKEAESIKYIMREYANLIIAGERKVAEKKRIEITHRSKIVSILCCKVEGF
jgi:hypothetical protein